ASTAAVDAGTAALLGTDDRFAAARAFYGRVLKTVETRMGVSSTEPQNSIFSAHAAPYAGLSCGRRLPHLQVKIPIASSSDMRLARLDATTRGELQKVIAGLVNDNVDGISAFKPELVAMKVAPSGVTFALPYPSAVVQAAVTGFMSSIPLESYFKSSLKDSSLTFDRNAAVVDEVGFVQVAFEVDSTTTKNAFLPTAVEAAAWRALHGAAATSAPRSGGTLLKTADAVAVTERIIELPYLGGETQRNALVAAVTAKLDTVTTPSAPVKSELTAITNGLGIDSNAAVTFVFQELAAQARRMPMGEIVYPTAFVQTACTVAGGALAMRKRGRDAIQTEMEAAFKRTVGKLGKAFAASAETSLAAKYAASTRTQGYDYPPKVAGVSVVQTDQQTSSDSFEVLFALESVAPSALARFLVDLSAHASGTTSAVETAMSTDVTASLGTGSNAFSLSRRAEVLPLEEVPLIYSFSHTASAKYAADATATTDAVKIAELRSLWSTELRALLGPYLRNSAADQTLIASVETVVKVDAVLERGTSETTHYLTIAVPGQFPSVTSSVLLSRLNAAARRVAFHVLVSYGDYYSASAANMVPTLSSLNFGSAAQSAGLVSGYPKKRRFATALSQVTLTDATNDKTDATEVRAAVAAGLLAAAKSGSKDSEFHLFGRSGEALGLALPASDGASAVDSYVQVSPSTSARKLFVVLPSWEQSAGLSFAATTGPTSVYSSAGVGSSSSGGAASFALGPRDGQVAWVTSSALKNWNCANHQCYERLRTEYERRAWRRTVLLSEAGGAYGRMLNPTGRTGDRALIPVLVVQSTSGAPFTVYDCMRACDAYGQMCQGVVLHSEQLDGGAAGTAERCLVQQPTAEDVAESFSSALINSAPDCSSAVDCYERKPGSQSTMTLMGTHVNVISRMYPRTIWPFPLIDGVTPYPVDETVIKPTSYRVVPAPLGDGYYVALGVGMCRSTTMVTAEMAYLEIQFKNPLTGTSGLTADRKDLEIEMWRSCFAMCDIYNPTCKGVQIYDNTNGGAASPGILTCHLVLKHQISDAPAKFGTAPSTVFPPYTAVTVSPISGATLANFTSQSATVDTVRLKSNIGDYEDLNKAVCWGRRRKVRYSKVSSGSTFGMSYLGGRSRSYVQLNTQEPLTLAECDIVCRHLGDACEGYMRSPKGAAANEKAVCVLQLLSPSEGQCIMDMLGSDSDEVEEIAEELKKEFERRWTIQVGSTQHIDDVEAFGKTSRELTPYYVVPGKSYGVASRNSEEADTRMRYHPLEHGLHPVPAVVYHVSMSATNTEHFAPLADASGRTDGQCKKADSSADDVTLERGHKKDMGHGGDDYDIVQECFDACEDFPECIAITVKLRSSDKHTICRLQMSSCPASGPKAGWTDNCGTATIEPFTLALDRSATGGTHTCWQRVIKSEVPDFANGGMLAHGAAGVWFKKLADRMEPFTAVFRKGLAPDAATTNPVDQGSRRLVVLGKTEENSPHRCVVFCESFTFCVSFFTVLHQASGEDFCALVLDTQSQVGEPDLPTLKDEDCEFTLKKLTVQSNIDPFGISFYEKGTYAASTRDEHTQFATISLASASAVATTAVDGLAPVSGVGYSSTSSATALSPWNLYGNSNAELSAADAAFGHSAFASAAQDAMQLFLTAPVRASYSTPVPVFAGVAFSNVATLLGAVRGSDGGSEFTGGNFVTSSLLSPVEKLFALRTGHSKVLFVQTRLQLSYDTANAAHVAKVSALRAASVRTGFQEWTSNSSENKFYLFLQALKTALAAAFGAHASKLQHAFSGVFTSETEVEVRIPISVPDLDVADASVTAVALGLFSQCSTSATSVASTLLPALNTAIANIVQIQGLVLTGLTATQPARLASTISGRMVVAADSNTPDSATVAKAVARALTSGSGNAFGMKPSQVLLIADTAAVANAASGTVAVFDFYVPGRLTPGSGYENSESGYAYAWHLFHQNTGSENGAATADLDRSPFAVLVEENLRRTHGSLAPNLAVSVLSGSVEESSFVRFMARQTGSLATDARYVSRLAAATAVEMTALQLQGAAGSLT
ncbi:unnamed protein product, partial [Amoebophrya sp. A25]